MLTHAAGRRIRGARLLSKAGGAIVLVTGAAGLAWTLSGYAVPSLDAVIVRVLPLSLLCWIGIAYVVQGRWEPLVATLGRQLEQREGSGAVGALAVLTRTERSDLVAVLFGATAGELEGWIVRGWLALGLAACWAALDFRELQNSPLPVGAEHSLYASFLVCTSLIIMGSLIAARARWRPLVLALQEAIGEAGSASVPEGREADTHLEGAPQPVAGLSPAEREGAARADLRFRNLIVLAGLMIYLAARGWGTPAWQPGQALAVAVAVAATFESGYILGRSRRRRIVARPRRSGPSRPSDSRHPERTGE